MFDSENIDEVCGKWNTSYLNLARQYIPNRVVEIRPRDKPWFTSELRKLKRLKDRLHKKAKNSQTIQDWVNFRTTRNQYNSKIREAEVNYRKSLADSLKNSKTVNPKQWWHITKQFMGKTTESVIPPMEKDGKTYFDVKEKADAFNKAFISFSDLDTTNASLPEFAFKTDSRLSNIIFAEDDVLNLLKSLDTSKATGPDGISAKMLKETAVSITPSFTRLLQLSFDKCQVPKQWKQANVIPLHKKDEKSNFANYRPISLLNITSKLCEKLVFKEVFNYLRDNDLITMHQSGFMPGDSTVHQLTYLYDLFCKALNDKKDVRLVFCDQSKAFDRVWHAGLVFKLKSFGITGPLLDWLMDYLRDRLQRISIDGIYSIWELIKAGVPQGSVLGPLLFIIYINDIVENIKSGIKLFADDTSLYITIDDNLNEATDQLNSDLDLLKAWSSQWLVDFNPQKTKSIYISLKKTVPDDLPPLYFDNVELENVDSHKHLGLILNTSLSWKDHIVSIASTANKKLNLLAHLKNLLDRKTLFIMYTSFIRPSIEYANVIWCNCTDTENDFLEGIQRRAARIITGGTISTSSKCLYEELAIETLKCRRDRNVMLMFHKIVFENAPFYLAELKPETTAQRQTYNLRKTNNFTTPLCRIQKYQKSFLPHAIDLWNKLPSDTKTLRDYDLFKSELEKNRPSENPLFCYGNREESIWMARFRMNCIQLNAHLSQIKVIDSPRCACGYKCEDAYHFFFICPLYNVPRAAFHNQVANHAPFTLRTILFGSDNLDLNENKLIYQETLKFIKSSRRFDLK